MKKIISPFGSDCLWTTVLAIYMASLFFDDSLVIAASVLLIGVTAIRCIYLWSIKKERLAKPAAIVYYWTAVYLVRVVWLLFSSNPANGIHWLDTCLPILLFPAVLQYYPLNDRVIRWTLTFFVCFSFVFCLAALVSIAYHIIAVPVNVDDWIRMPKRYSALAYTWSNCNHPSFLSMIFLMALPAGLYLHEHYRTFPLKALCLLFLLEAAVILFTGARIGLILLPLLAGAMIVYKLPRMKCKLVAAGLFAGGLAALVIIVMANPSLSHFFNDSIRQRLLEMTTESISTHPWLGVGTGAMRDVINPINAEMGLHDGYITYPHNQYLTEVMHFGLIGAMAFFAAILYIIVTAIRRNDILLQGWLIILFVSMATDNPFDMCKPLNFSMFFISLFFAVAGKNSNYRKI
jgi:O-antigen ligase